MLKNISNYDITFYEMLDLFNADYISITKNEVEFIPEVSKDGYIIGHTGNYLQIKSKIKSNGHETIKTTIKSIEYPYCMD